MREIIDGCGEAAAVRHRSVLNCATRFNIGPTPETSVTLYFLALDYTETACCIIDAWYIHYRQMASFVYSRSTSHTGMFPAHILGFGLTLFTISIRDIIASGYAGTNFAHVSM